MKMTSFCRQQSYPPCWRYTCCSISATSQTYECFQTVVCVELHSSRNTRSAHNFGTRIFVFPHFNPCSLCSVSDVTAPFVYSLSLNRLYTYHRGRRNHVHYMHRVFFQFFFVNISFGSVHAIDSLVRGFQHVDCMYWLSARVISAANWLLSCFRREAVRHSKLHLRYKSQRTFAFRRRHMLVYSVVEISQIRVDWQLYTCRVRGSTDPC